MECSTTTTTTDSNATLADPSRRINRAAKFAGEKALRVCIRGSDYAALALDNNDMAVSARRKSSQVDETAETNRQTDRPRRGTGRKWPGFVRRRRELLSQTATGRREKYCIGE